MLRVPRSSSYAVALAVVTLFAFDAGYASASLCGTPSEQCQNGTCCNATTCAFLNTTHVCRPANGSCDEPESCNGTSAECPADTFKAAGTLCRAKNGTCDVADNCTGLSAECPYEYEPDTVVCRASAFPCDEPEMCTGMSGECPTDRNYTYGTECFVARGYCDNGTCLCSPGYFPQADECNVTDGPPVAGSVMLPSINMQAGQVDVSWSFTQDRSSIVAYAYAIGTPDNAEMLLSYQNVSSATSTASLTGLSFYPGQTYAASVIATNEAKLSLMRMATFGPQMTHTLAVSPSLSAATIFTLVENTVYVADAYEAARRANCSVSLPAGVTSSATNVVLEVLFGDNFTSGSPFVSPSAATPAGYNPSGYSFRLAPSGSSGNAPSATSAPYTLEIDISNRPDPTDFQFVIMYWTGSQWSPAASTCSATSQGVQDNVYRAQVCRFGQLALFERDLNPPPVNAPPSSGSNDVTVTLAVIGSILFVVVAAFLSVKYRRKRSDGKPYDEEELPPLSQPRPPPLPRQRAEPQAPEYTKRFTKAFDVLREEEKMQSENTLRIEWDRNRIDTIREELRVEPDQRRRHALAAEADALDMEIKSLSGSTSAKTHHARAHAIAPAQQMI